jgi:hypothetical protein
MSCRPPKNINTAKTSEIGKFNPKDIKDVELEEADIQQYERWDFLNVKHFQKEVVEFMRYEDVLVSIPEEGLTLGD